MDKKIWTNLLKETKNRWVEESDGFITALNKMVESETKFRSSLSRLSNKMTTSKNDAIKLRQELDLGNVTQIIADTKKELKFGADYQMEIKREIKLSRKRTQKFDEIYTEFKRIFCAVSTDVVEIPDSPRRLDDDDSDKCNDLQVAKSTPKSSMVVAPIPRMPAMCKSVRMLKEKAEEMLAKRPDSQSSADSSSPLKEKHWQQGKHRNVRPDSRSSNDSFSRFYTNKQFRFDISGGDKPSHLKY